MSSIWSREEDADPFEEVYDDMVGESGVFF